MILALPTGSSFAYSAEMRRAIERARAINDLPSEIGATGCNHAVRMPQPFIRDKSETPWR